jgi:hypothetical protein
VIVKLGNRRDRTAVALPDGEIVKQPAVRSTLVHVTTLAPHSARRGLDDFQAQLTYPFTTPILMRCDGLVGTIMRFRIVE